MTYVILALAVYRLTRLVTTDTFPPIQALRDWVLSRWPTDDTDFTEEAVHATETGWETSGGAEVFYLDGTFRPTRPSRWAELVTCAWCAGFWIAVCVTAAWYWWPAVTEWVALPFAFSAAAGLLTVWGD